MTLKEEIAEILDELSVTSYYKGKGNKYIKLVDEINTAQDQILSAIRSKLDEKGVDYGKELE